ncbi:MAG: hypothetical protein LBB55_06080 [Zoogloeaceae bacterium]|jgi:hypothetical protein|nr:hypothetical protein [Zoogloeaceae bacterium]
MKKKKKQKKTPPIFTLRGMANDFTRGFVSYAAVEAAIGSPALPAFDADLLRHSTLAGAALVAGVAAGKAVERGNYLTALATAAGGVLGVYVLQNALRQKYSSTTKNVTDLSGGLRHGQEA